MTKYRPREQKAVYVVPIRMLNTATIKRPLPDMGEPKTNTPPSARRYKPIMPDPVTRKQRVDRENPSFRVLFVAGMVLMLALWFSGSLLISAWQNASEQWSYGNTRTAHFDAHVGHDDAVSPSHFIAMNLKGQVHVIEFPGGDAAKAKVYLGPVLQGDENAPVTLKFADVSGDHKVDMLLLVREVPVGVFINDTIRGVPQFRPARTDESIVI